ncbi:unnamed protein product, partial [Pneumocystis jirovecii]
NNKGNKNQPKSSHKKQKTFSNKLEKKKDIFLDYNVKSFNHLEKISLTHLFNFSYPQLFHTSQVAIHLNCKNTKNQQKSRDSFHYKGKEYFINSNYRFIVNPYEDYRVQTLDPDIPIPWKNIFQILISRLAQHRPCPICLDEDPIAPRITKYLKPIRWYDNVSSELPIEGKEILLRLFIHKQGYIYAFPYENFSKNTSEGVIPWYFEQDVMDYSRIMKASEDYMIGEINRELEQLEKIKNNEKEHIELVEGSIDKTIQCIQQSILSFKKMLDDHKNPCTTPISLKHKSNIEELSQEINKKLHMQDNTSNNSTKPSYDIQKTNSYLFYRPQIVAHYYLSMLDIKILKAAFGDYKFFPPNIIARIENISTGHVVDNPLRKRIKYLSHLPCGCEVSFLECDWSDVIDESILHRFDSEICKRRQKRREKIMQESKCACFREKNCQPK